MNVKYRKPYRIKKKKSIFQNRFFWIFIFILIIFGVIFYFFTFSSFFQVEKIIISGQERVEKEEVKSLIEEKLEKKILFLPTKSIFLVNLRRIKEDILTSFPQIAEVKIGRGFPDVLNIIIKERKEIAVFCQDENCFFLDEKGVIFETTQLEGNLIKIIDERKVDNVAVLGEKVIEKDYLEKILKIQEYILEEFEFETKEFIILIDRLTAKTTEDWQIFFDPKGDLNWQLTKLQLVLKEKIPSEKRGDLEYIELRFGDLAPYKFR